MQKRAKLVIGRTDTIDFPEFKLCAIEAKIDTGAYTSAIHCERIKRIDDNGVAKISFHILGSHQKGVRQRRFMTENFKEKIIRNSFGQIERRFVIRTKIVLFGKRINTDFSLSDRTEMRFPVLLGRKLLRNRFIVDVSLQNVSHAQKRPNNQPVI